MKIVGIITEYNPFHNGHLYHIQRIREISKCDLLVCVMSGNFVMRGNVSVLDKYFKTEIALKYGIDLIAELPFYYVNQASDLFAYGAISILKKLCVTDIYFGSESHNIEFLYAMYKKSESLSFKEAIKSYLKEGISYAASYQKALGFTLQSNDLLGIEYIRANEDLKASIHLHTIKRIGSNYNDSLIQDSSIQSASYLRTISDPNGYVPQAVKDYLVLNSKRDIADFFEYAYYQFTVLSKKELRDFLHISEGLENLFLKNLNRDYKQFMENVKTKRYSENKTNRSLMSILLNFKKTDFIKKEPDYLFILGFNLKGKSLLNLIKKDSKIYTKGRPKVNFMMDLQMRADALYQIKYPQTAKKNGPLLF